MIASTNATRVFWGTAWTMDTLLERQRKLALHAQEQDGLQRVFFYTAEDICRYVPAYGLTVDRVIAEKGRNHPLVRTQYFCETIEAEAGMFNAARLALIFNTFPSPASQDLEAGGLGSSSVGSDFPVEVAAFPERRRWRYPGSQEEFTAPILRKVIIDTGEWGRWSVTPPPEELGPEMIEEFYAFYGTRLEEIPAASSPSPSLSLENEAGASGVLQLSTVEPENEEPARPSPHLCSRTNPYRSFAFLIDVAGIDENRLSAAGLIQGEGLGNPGRDSTTLTVVEVDLSTLEELHRPTYRVVERHAWTGESHLVVFGKLKNLAQRWSPQHLVIDATGVGEGLWALLDRAFPSRVIPVKFTLQEKSEIGWRFLSIIETGRFMDPITAANSDRQSEVVQLQYTRCICEILPGPVKTLRWGVPDGARGPDGELVHDDFILADALTAKLDDLDWHIHFPTYIIPPGVDPLKEMGRDF